MNEVLPPPPPRRADDGCWKWGAIGCVGCGFLILIGGIGLFMLGRPLVEQVMKGMEKGQVVSRDMRSLNSKIEEYKQKKGKYPAKLKDLVPNFVTEDRGLHTAADPNGPEFTYFPPDKDAAGGTVILQYELPAPIPANDAPPWTIRMTKDGRIENEVYEYRSGRSRVRLGQ